MNGYYSPMYPSQAMMGGNTLMPMYPLYQYHQTHTMGLPAHIFQPTTTGHVAIMSKAASMTPNTGASHGNMPTPKQNLSTSVKYMSVSSNTNHCGHVAL